MANNFTPVGSELQINLAPNQIGEQVDPDIATLTDGLFFVAFQDIEASANIIGQFVNPDGTLSGSNIDIDIGVGVQLVPAVAQRAAGAAVVVWEDRTAGDDIQYSIVSSGGAQGAEQTILSGVDPLRSPDVATLANGSSLVVARQSAAASEDIVFRFIDATGNPTGVLDVVDNGANDQSNPAVAAFDNNALVAYAEFLGGDNYEIQARFFNGTSFATEVTIAGATHELLDPDVAALTDGRFVVVWNDGLSENVMARFVSAAGVPLGSAFNLTAPGGDDFRPRVAALPDGGFIVTFQNFEAHIPPEITGDTSAVLARRFDSTGAPAGDLFIVNTGDPETDQFPPAVAANTTTGQAFIVWPDAHAFTGAGEDANPVGIRGRAFLATTEVVNGTAGDDAVTTYGLGETINGLGGDDLINAVGGNDIVHGGAGFDHIKGGLGNDKLFGEGGEDLLKGEDGDDLLVGGRGRDVQIGGAGKDTFDFNAFNESRVGANHDVIKGFSRGQHDKINLQTIDADTTAGGNQAFDLIGAAAFTGTAGELRFAGGLLLGDTNGDGVANFEVKVSGLGAAVNGDFVL